MKNTRKKAGKDVLVKAAMAKGFTARKATKAVNAVVDLMKFALWCGEPVEIPGGTIQANMWQGKPRGELHKFVNVQTGKVGYKMVKYPGRHSVIKFTPDESLDFTPPPVLPPPVMPAQIEVLAPILPPPPEPPEEIEARQLAGELLGLKQPSDRALMVSLQRAAEVHRYKPGSLLRRLREFKARGWQFGSVHSLAERLTEYYWL
jgi:hypothetical protein